MLELMLASPVAGLLPISGALHTMNETLDIGKATLSVSSFDPDTDRDREVGSTDIRFAGIRVAAGSNEDLRLNSIRWNQTGSAGVNDIANVVTVVDGVEYETTISADGDYYNVDFGTGIVIAKGANVDIYIKGDIIGGTGRNVVFDIHRSTDINISGEMFAFGITPDTDTPGTAETDSSDFTNGTPFFDNAHLTITGGSATTISRSTEVPAQNIAVNVSGEILGAFETDFRGEAVTVSSMEMTVASTIETS